MTRELAMVHAREGIRLNSICPYVHPLRHFPHMPALTTRCIHCRGPLKTRKFRYEQIMCTIHLGRILLFPALLMDFLNTPEKRDRRMVHLPMGRFGEAIEVAKGALFRT